MSSSLPPADPALLAAQAATPEALRLTERLRQRAEQLGFGLFGVCRATEPAGIERFRQWLDAGHHGEMHYLSNRAEAYSHPRHVLDGVRSIVMLGFDYQTLAPQTPLSGEGRVARYAWATDYHDLLRERLNQLAKYLGDEVPEALVRGVVDTAPLLEREFAQLAGLGWVGKNTLLINRQRGSWFFLAALLTSLELATNASSMTDYCGTCRACLDACPTDAFPQPYVLDARRCISYLTIELRSPIPRSLRSGLQDWVFGCDVCQDACPWNRRAPRSEEPALQPEPETNPLPLVALFGLDEAGFRARFRHSPLWRAKRRGILRNAAIVLGNQRSADSLAALQTGLSDTEPLVRGASAWALGQLAGEAASGEAAEAAMVLLRERLTLETDAEVRQEIELALADATGASAPAAR